MGLFGGKKKPQRANETEPSEQRRTTRRAVVPTTRNSEPDSEARNKAVVKPATQRSSGSSTQIKIADHDRGSAAPPIKQLAPTISGGLISSKPPPTTPSGGLISATPSERPGRSPIQAGQSKPPDFTGALTSAKAGPCRTGDSALLDFLLTKAKLLNESQAASAQEKARNDNLPLDVAAVQLGFISEEQMVNALTQECWVPHLKVDKYEIRKKALDTITSDDASHYGVFPVDKLGSLLTLAMINPLDAETIRILESKTGLDIKKVVATRSEITQGIEKYYSGKVQAKDGSISFTQDIEPKSVTAMMARVSPAGSPPPSRPMPAVKAPEPPPVSDSIVPEIQDIDELLAGDEAIAPAIIEPISIKAEVAPIELAATPAPVRSEHVEPLVRQKPTSAPLAASQPQTADFALGDIAPTVIEPVLTPKLTPPAVIEQPVALKAKPPAPKPAPEALAPEFDEPVPAIASPRITPVAAPAAPLAPIAPAKPTPPLTAPAARPAVVSSSFTSAADGRIQQAPAPKGATSRISASSRVERSSGVINLIPVLEDEFQHAITHGKARVFEKWVGLQTRNRIINAVPIESEMDALLAGLYAGAKTI